MTSAANDRDEWSWATADLKKRILSDPAAVLEDRGLSIPADLPLPIVHEFIRVAWLLWVDGKILPLDQFFIDPADEGLLFGRGLWESTRTVDGIPWLWPLHMDRLRQTAELLNIALDPERLPDAKQVNGFVRTLTRQDVLVRLNVTAGRPGKPGLVWMSAAPQPVLPPSVRLRTFWSPVQKGQPYLMMKTFQYATRLRIAHQAAQVGYDNALLLDPDGNLLEAANANIFVRLPDGWATPLPDGGFLPGTVRLHLLQAAPLPIREQRLPQALLSQVSEAFVTNSNAGIVPVTQIDDYTLPIGEETASLIRWLSPPPSTEPQIRFRDRGGIRR